MSFFCIRATDVDGSLLIRAVTRDTLQVRKRPSPPNKMAGLRQDDGSATRRRVFDKMAGLDVGRKERGK